MAKKRNKKIHKFKILFYTLIVGVFIYYCIDHKIAKDSLIKNTGFSTAIIIDFQTERTGKFGRESIIKYWYKIEDKILTGKGKRNNLYHLLDTIVIVYDTTNYEYSMPYFDFQEKDLLPPLPDSLKKWNIYRKIEIKL